MTNYLPAEEKIETQQRYRRFVECFEQVEEAQAALSYAKASRIWVVGAGALLFSFSSDFFLGMAAAFIGGYCYQVVAANIKKGQVDERLEEMERWFKSKGLVFHDTAAFSVGDEQLANPIDLLDDAAYQSA